MYRWYHGQSKCAQFTGSSFLNQLYLSIVPPTRPVWHKAFLRWVQAQGPSLDAPGGSKNASGPVGISLKKGRYSNEG